MTRLTEPLLIQLPDTKYRPYNKANNRLVFSNPTHYIYWEDEGRAVLTYKRTGNWYLRGVGGQPYLAERASLGRWWRRDSIRDTCPRVTSWTVAHLAPSFAKALTGMRYSSSSGGYSQVLPITF